MYKTLHTFEKRCEESKKIREKYVDRVPIICERAARNSELPEIDRKKFLVPIDLTMGQFMHIIKKRIKLAPEQAMFLFINNTIPPNSEYAGELYKRNKDEDGFLYIVYNGESTFGANN